MSTPTTMRIKGTPQAIEALLANEKLKELSIFRSQRKKPCPKKRLVDTTPEPSAIAYPIKESYGQHCQIL